MSPQTCVINPPSKSTENVKTRQKLSEKTYFSVISKLLINIIIRNMKKLNFFRYELFVFYEQKVPTSPICSPPLSSSRSTEPAETTVTRPSLTASPKNLSTQLHKDPVIVGYLHNVSPVTKVLKDPNTSHLQSKRK